jgi:hypothetical protein
MPQAGFHARLHGTNRGRDAGMGLWDTLLLWLHFVALGLGGSALFGGLVIAATIPKTPLEARPPLAQVRGRLVLFGRVGLGLLILTGVLMVRDVGTGQIFWFAIKMLLVLALTASVIYTVPLGRKAQAGDAAAIARMGQLLRVNLGLYLAIILAAVLTFD